MIKKFTVLLLSFMVASVVSMPVNVFAQPGTPEEADDPNNGDRPPVTETAASTEDKEVQSAPYVRGIEAFGGRVAEELTPQEQKQCPSACITQLRESGEALPAGTFTANVGGAIVDAMAVKADASDTNNQQLFAVTYGELTGREVISQSEAYDVYNPAANNSVVTVSSVTFEDKESGAKTQGYVMYDGNTTQVVERAPQFMGVAEARDTKDNMAVVSYYDNDKPKFELKSIDPILPPDDPSHEFDVLYNPETGTYYFHF